MVCKISFFQINATVNNTISSLGIPVLDTLAYTDNVDDP